MSHRHSRVHPTIYLLALAGVLVVALPIAALLVRVSWSTIAHHIASTDSLQALRVSLLTAIAAALCAVVLGVPVAWVLARGSQRVARFVRPVVMAPIVLPPTVAGLALLALLGRNGIIGHVIFESTGFAMPFTMSAVVLAGVFVGMPFLIMVMESAFLHLDRDVEDAAETDGADARRIFWSISLPQARGAFLSAFTLAWARALGEFGATLTFAGSFPGVTRTLPQQVYVALETDIQNAYALSVLLVIVAISLMLLLRGRLRNPFSPA